MSVLLAVHNGERFVRAAIESILAQSFRDFEFIIVDDASTDQTPAILDSFDDARMVRVASGENLGLTRALNLGLEHARAPLIARIDADDLALPQRLERQVDYMRRQPDATVLGSAHAEIDSDDHELREHRPPVTPQHLRWEMSWRNSIYHSTVMMRREPIMALGGYDPQMRYAQDHDLWTRVLRNGGAVHVLPEVLARYRRSPEQLSLTRGQEQEACGRHVRQQYLAWLTDSAPQLSAVDSYWRMMELRPLAEIVDAGAAVELLLSVRQRCRAGADRVGRRLIDAAARRTLLHHAAMALREPAQPELARLLWRAATRLGAMTLLEPRWWKRTFSLLRPAAATAMGRATR